MANQPNNKPTNLKFTQQDANVIYSIPFKEYLLVDKKNIIGVEEFFPKLRYSCQTINIVLFSIIKRCSTTYKILLYS